MKIGHRKGKCQPLLAIVADGMGGHAAGSMASELVVQMLSDWWEQKGEASLWANLPVKEEIKEVLTAANQRLVDYGIENGVKTGTTLSLLLLYNEKFQVFHTGDSRIYKLGGAEPDTTTEYIDISSRSTRDATKTLQLRTTDNSGLIQLTEDQSWVALQVRQGKMSKEKARIHPRRNMLLECLGVDPAVNIITRRGAFKTEDTFLLCCDGYYALFSDHEISNDLQTCLLAGMDLQSISEHLVQAALEREAHDNVSVIVVRQVERKGRRAWSRIMDLFRRKHY